MGFIKLELQPYFIFYKEERKKKNPNFKRFSQDLQKDAISNYFDRPFKAIYFTIKYITLCVYNLIYSLFEILSFQTLQTQLVAHCNTLP